MIIAGTVRGLGVKRMEGDPGWHVGRLVGTDSEYLAAWFGPLRRLVARQLMLDRSAVVGDPMSDGQFELLAQRIGI